MRNQTQMPEFILLGLTSIPELKRLLFGVLFLAYTLTLMGNVLLIIITCTDYRLHSPMYFFLQDLSFLEICLTTVVVPRMLTDLRTERRTISFAACLSQYFFHFFFGGTEFFLLTAMSFDRYVAICCPLRYTSIMSQRLCFLLVIFSWVGGLLLILTPIVLTSQLSFCKSNVINHFFCDYTPLLQISCGDKHLLELIHFLLAFFTLLSTLLLILVSYTYILITIMQIPSAKERQRAFSTCSSHLIVISICYGSCILMYVRPIQEEDLDLNKGLAIINTVLAPLLNPFIYTLRNQQVQEALREVARKLFYPKDMRVSMQCRNNN
ncbi:olfactory receptor 2AP1-like [Malaclemys terrapin pileata]|uniref:olfactory receptor 2AP1-like n=1 Tax=Malaclemys terrapin pileata TaxID=2991368 RepID=UPI0023A80784|nr:olfactory receptor 2AP1-like [Malaclemys terrapin pileata]